MVVELLGQVLHLARSEVVDHQTLLVGLIAGTLLRAEGNLLAAWRPYGILIVTNKRIVGIALADIHCFATCEVVNKDIRVGRNGILRTCERLASIGEFLAVGAPRNLGVVEVWSKRCIPSRLLAYDIDTLAYALGCKVGNKDVDVVTLIPIVPMAHHQIIIDASLRLCHIGIDIGRVDILDVNKLRVVDVCLVWRDTEALDTALNLRHLLRLRAVGLHLPQLHLATAVCSEPDSLAICTPNRRNRGCRGVGQLALLARSEVATNDNRNTTILRHIVAGEGVKERFAIGREGMFAYTTHLPHHIGSEACGSNLLGGEAIVNFDRLGRNILSHEARK